MKTDTISRAWAMPNSETFSIPVIREFIGRYLSTEMVSIDPFARNKKLATFTNDLNPNTTATFHMEARRFLAAMLRDGVRADVVLFDPPYSPRQIAECYQSAGLAAGMADTQNAKLCRECRELITQLSRPGGVVLSFGWNSVGMGAQCERLETLIVCHGGAHNDTICVADKLTTKHEDFPSQWLATRTAAQWGAA